MESIYTNTKYKVYAQAILCTLTLYGIWIASRKWGVGRGGWIYVRVEGGRKVVSVTRADDIYMVLIYILHYITVSGISAVIFKMFSKIWTRNF